MYVRVVLGVILCALVSTSAMAAGQGRLIVYTVNYPLQYFAQRIAGDHADVIFPAPADGDPAFWQPSIDIIAAYQQADLILLNGADYAKWINRAALPRRKLVDTSAGFSDHYIHVTAGATHSHGPGGDHSHAGTAFTTWLDFNQAAGQARAIADAMIRERPIWQKDFSRNLAALEADLQTLDQQLQSMVAAQPDQSLLASHPVYQYLAARYDLDIRSVTWEPDEAPLEMQWVELAAMRADHPASIMLWEAEPLEATRSRLEKEGIRVVVFSQCGNRPGGGTDFMMVMRENIEALSMAAR